MNQIKSFHFLGTSLLLASASLSGACQGSLALRPPTPTFAARAHVGPSTATSSADRYAAPPAAASQGSSAGAPDLPPSTITPTTWQGPIPSEDPATAPFLTLGETLQGAVNANVPLYYKVQLKRGQTATVTGLVGNTTDTDGQFRFRLIDPDAVHVLSGLENIWSPAGEFERVYEQASTPVSGEHLFKIWDTRGRTEYKIRLESPDA